MGDILTAIQSVRNRPDDERGDALLTAVQSSNNRLNRAFGNGESSTKDEAILLKKSTNDNTTPSVSSPQEALALLRSQPGQVELLAILNQLRQHAFPSGPFSLHVSGPQQAQIINALVVEILPNFLPVLDNAARDDFASCLRTVAGIGALVTRLRYLSAQSQDGGNKSQDNVVSLIQTIEHVLLGNQAVSGIWSGLLVHIPESTNREMMWKECVSLLSSGKIVSTVAQSEGSLEQKVGSWLADGNLYAAWLARNLANMAVVNTTPGSIEAASQLLARSMSLGFPNVILNAFFSALSRRGKGFENLLEAVSRAFPGHVQHAMAERILRWLSSIPKVAGEDSESTSTVAAVAAFLQHWMYDDSSQDRLVSLMTDPTLLSSFTLSVRRACIEILAKPKDSDRLTGLLEQMLSTFSDRLFANHAPNIQQEALTSTLLVAVGVLHRQNPIALDVIGRSSPALRATSTRLDGSNSRARWLGMVVATAISRLIDKEGSRLNFGTDELETDEAEWYFKLTTAQNRIGTIEEFSTLLDSPSRITVSKSRPPHHAPKPSKMPSIDGKPVFGPLRPPAQTGITGDRVTELPDDHDQDDNDDDLKPYAKPDSDPEDSDEDATLVNRNKIRPPVYVRDLMSMLRDDKSHDRFQMGIKNAASLIRRKTNFGAEVKDHAEELASILCNLRDSFDTDNFDELKLQALIAVLLADVKSLGPWLSLQAFSGDYSIAQRCAILSAIGLGGRELAGFAKQDNALNPTVTKTAFPSKLLPPHLHSIYGAKIPATNQLDTATSATERSLLNPIALQAADQSTSQLDAVKVRTFSSRIAVERTKRKPTGNQLAKVFGESFFFPLANRYQQDVSAYGSASVYASAPFMLVTFLKTLALLLNASGPATVDLSRITAEFWELLLSLRVQAIGNISILQALLFSFLCLLEIHHDKRRLAEDFPRQLMETQQWVELIFERTGGGTVIDEKSDNEEAQVRSLAAGILLRAKEIIELYQKQFVGDMRA